MCKVCVIFIFFWEFYCFCVVIKIWGGGNTGGAPWWSYWSAGITNTIGPAMGIEALKYISYPAQVKCYNLNCIVLKSKVLSKTMVWDYNKNGKQNR